jgi:hypothetical protein
MLDIGERSRIFCSDFYHESSISSFSLAEPRHATVMRQDGQDSTRLVTDGRFQYLPSYHHQSFNTQNPTQTCHPNKSNYLSFKLNPRVITSGNRKPSDVCPPAQQCRRPKPRGVPSARTPPGTVVSAHLSEAHVLRKPSVRGNQGGDCVTYSVEGSVQPQADRGY